MDAHRALEAFRARQPDAVKNEMVVDTVHHLLYHISPNSSIPVFTPRPIQRTMDGEDESVKRVCTATTILDCLRGYAVTVRDYLDNKANCAGNDSWLGGYYIYGIPVEGSIKPSPVLAPIAEWSEERWLVNYGQDDQPYPGKIIGKMFIQELKVQRHEGERTLETYVLLDIQVPEMRVSPLLSLKRGFYRLTIPSLERYNDRPLDHTQIETVALSEKEYNDVKTHRAGLLSYENVQATKIRW